MKRSLRPVELSVRVYEVLIKAYPASFRREYGSELMLVFREHITDAWRKRGAIGVMAAWFWVLGDLARTVPAEHVHEIQRRLEMRSVALAVLSVLLAPVVYFAISLAGMIGIAWIIVGSPRLIPPIVVATWYLSAFLTGLILTRVKPSFAPAATAPMATMAIVAIWGFGACLDSPDPDRVLGWSALVLYVGFVTSVGLASFLGYVIATKAASRLARFSVPWFHLVRPLAVLVCTSSVACVLRIMLLGNQIASDLQQALTTCLFGLLVIGLVAIADIVLLFVRSHKPAAVP
jgi:hypothetical protein